ncbi:hypothetical protein M413DRAFT_444471 [Hebeloma cylindrosporum]|uniref:Cyclin-domain-containing protein n=1 Tax=Hebeloma cylindrosporum TaxID=76867 RepID=A0A0C2XYW2_HEBCY|nr:hypothetical protein M413DRAFT_444471 [Hebeloma cylindrosporum h7]
MLAVVQPYSASPDVGHRSRSNISPSRSISNLAHAQPPSLQRHQTAPAAPSQSRIPTPPPKPPTPTPTPILPDSSKFDIHSFPPADLLKLLALLLTHIAKTNDQISQSNPSSSPTHSQLTSPGPIDTPIWHTLTTASRTAISTPAATMTFHARNIPTISLEAYLLRILKYCPTTNHVFLSLLVYFDRMSKLSGDAVGRTFIIDSYNIHRLVIAGVTVASKFFSDVFYTNSRYAKVGGLPLPELNQLELQFLLLNDFRLVISTTEMQHYAEQLIQFAKANPTSEIRHMNLPSITTTTTTNGHGNASSHLPFSSSASSSSSSSLPPSVSASVTNHPTSQTLVPPSPAASHSVSSGSGSSSNRTIVGLAWGAHSERSSPSASTSYVSTPIHNPPIHPASIPQHTQQHQQQHQQQHHHPSGYSSQTHQPHYPNTRTATNLAYPPPVLHRQHSHGVVVGSRTPPGPASQLQSHSLPNIQTSKMMVSESIGGSGSGGGGNGGGGGGGDDMEDDDADTSTDAGTETSTDDEPTIRGPGTVFGGSVNGGSVWGDEEEEGVMRSP